MEEKEKLKRFSASLIQQGDHKFYSFTVPSDVLAQTCFVTTREEDPIKGFQRILDSNRAQQIADYIDKDGGTIPSSVVLSAQPEAQFSYDSYRRVVSFLPHPKAFLILDGQHRVYGFTKSKSRIRIPVIVYNNLDRLQETRLFIDINTKQRPVPNELLLDIKSQADYESETEALFSELFEMFNSNPGSALLGKMSSSKKTTGKISRVTFYAALKPLYNIILSTNVEQAYTVLNYHLWAFYNGFVKLEIEDLFVKPIFLRGVLGFFPIVAQKVKDKDRDYSLKGFEEAAAPIFDKASDVKIRKIEKIAELQDYFAERMKKSFTI